MITSSTNSTENWLFIAGCNNSGTTLLYEILAQHPEIASLPMEGQRATDQFTLPDDLGLPRLWSSNMEAFRRTEADDITSASLIRDDWLKQLNDPTRHYYLEKSPPNTVRTRWLQASFPNASFIGLVRNGYAVSEGIRRRNGYSVEVAAKHWANSNRIMRADWSHLKRQIFITYEGLTTDPFKTLTMICEFLNITTDRELILNLLSTTWQIHDYQSTIHNMNDKSLKCLSVEDIMTIHTAATDMLDYYNYQHEYLPSASIPLADEDSTS